MSITQGLTALAVFAGLGFIIVAKMVKQNPRVASFINSLKREGIVNKEKGNEKEKEIEKIAQGTMM